MIGLEESSYTDRHARAASYLMPIVCWHVEAVTRLDMRHLNACISHKRILLIVRVVELDRRVVLWKALGTAVDELAVIWVHDRKVFVALVNTHHVLHRVGVRPSEGSMPVPVRHLFDKEELVHNRR